MGLNLVVFRNSYYLCAMRDKVKQRIIQYVLLIAGVIMLLSVVAPHHHHRDGTPCYDSLTTESAHGDKSADTHDCSCDGHNLAYFNSLISHVTDGSAHQYLMPLLVLFDYIYPPGPVFYERQFYRENTIYVESLRGTWIVNATGLRAPPMS